MFNNNHHPPIYLSSHTHYASLSSSLAASSLSIKIKTMRSQNSSSTSSRRTRDGFIYNSSPSSIRSDASSGLRGKNPVAVVAKSVAGAFGSCFAPPDIAKDSNINESPPKRNISVKSDGSRASSVQTRGSNKSRHSSSTSTSYTARSVPGSMSFNMDEISKATKNFSPAFKIGQGGFGTVYKGRLEDGSLVAIKRAKKSVYDSHLGVEFKSEIRTLSRIEHLNLVKFYGYLEHKDEKIVVVEYVPNGTLREHLDGMHGDVLDLAVRLDIAIDVAHAITYLHMYTDHPIIHRDIKSSNILLTETFRAKVADFGFSRLAADNDSGATHVSTQVKGTAGYLDPEYLRTYQLTEKSDVYSFGVLLVELITGRRPIEAKREIKERVTTRWAMKKFADGDSAAILDPKLELTAANNLVLEKVLELALQCVHSNRRERPTMKQCAEFLWGVRKDYKELIASDVSSIYSHSLVN